MQRYRDLKVWQRSHALVLSVYGFTKTFPNEELFGLTSQLRRSSTSVPANIAEGAKRKSIKNFAYFLKIAEASLSETDYFILLSGDLGYLKADVVEKHLAEVSEIERMLYALRRKVESAE